MPAGDRVAEAVKTARRAAGLTLSEVESHTRELERRDPARYRTVSKSLVSVIENEGADYFQRNVHHGKIRALIQVLYGGNEALWTEMTGIRVHLIDPGDVTASAIEAAVPVESAGQPVYREGHAGLHRGEVMFGLKAVGTRAAEMPATDFMVEVTSPRMIPLCFPGQLIGAQLATALQPGNVMVVQRAGEGLTLAWAVAEEQLLYQSGGAPWALRPADEVIGVVTHVRPQIPQGVVTG